MPSLKKNGLVGIFNFSKKSKTKQLKKSKKRKKKGDSFKAKRNKRGQVVISSELGY